MPLELAEESVATDKQSALFCRYLNGDEHAFRELYEISNQGFLTIAFRWTNDWELAEDLVQESWARAIATHTFTRSGKFSSWFISIIHNIYVDHYRYSHSMGRNRTLLFSDVYSETGIPEKVFYKSGLEKNLDQRNELSEMLLILPERYRMILEKVLEGNSVEDLSKEFNRNPNTLHSQIRAAKDLIKRRFEKSYA